MTLIEDRLRDALEAAARIVQSATVRPLTDPDPAGRAVTGSRAKLRRRLVPAADGAAIAIGGQAVLLAHPPPGGPVGAAQRRRARQPRCAQRRSGTW